LNWWLAKLAFPNAKSLNPFKGLISGSKEKAYLTGVFREYTIVLSLNLTLTISQSVPHYYPLISIYSGAHMQEEERCCWREKARLIALGSEKRLYICMCVVC